MERDKILLERIKDTVAVKIQAHDFEKLINELVDLLVKEKVDKVIQGLNDANCTLNDVNEVEQDAKGRTSE